MIDLRKLENCDKSAMITDLKHFLSIRTCNLLLYSFACFFARDKFSALRQTSAVCTRLLATRFFSLSAKPLLRNRCQRCATALRTLWSSCARRPPEEKRWSPSTTPPLPVSQVLPHLVTLFLPLRPWILPVCFPWPLLLLRLFSRSIALSCQRTRAWRPVRRLHLRPTSAVGMALPFGRAERVCRLSWRSQLPIMCPRQYDSLSTRADTKDAKLTLR